LIRSLIDTRAIGDVHAIKGLSLLKRTKDYFSRTPWAGKLSVGGAPVLDGTIHNPVAHLLFSMLVLADLVPSTAGSAVQPESVNAELYHGNPIESDDTSCLRAAMNNGIELLLYTTLCAKAPASPRIRLQGTKGVIEWAYDNRIKVWLGDAEEPEHYDC